jgi:hypothetical protein
MIFTVVILQLAYIYGGCFITPCKVTYYYNFGKYINSAVQFDILGDKQYFIYNYYNTITITIK